jgi:multisubunit Na+/H+ antiporter MnhB subunit
MRTCVKVRTLAAVIAVAAVGGCSAAPAVGHSRAGGGLAGYWTRAELLGASP